MRERHSYLNILFTIIICSSFITLGYSQTEYKRSYEVCLTNLPLQDFTFIFTQRLNDKNYLEVTNSFVIHKAKEQDVGSLILFQLKDPFKLYDMYRLRIGYRHYWKNNNYICPMLVFNYGRYKNSKLIHYIDETGDAYDEDYVINRTRYDIGTILKFGYTKTYNNQYIRDIYWGLGFKIKYFNDDILEKWRWHSYYLNDDYPIHKEYIGFMPTFHFGILVGYIE